MLFMLTNSPLHLLLYVHNESDERAVGRANNHSAIINLGPPPLYLSGRSFVSEQYATNKRAIICKTVWLAACLEANRLPTNMMGN